MPDLTPVRLLANYRIWNVGEIAGFADAELEKILTAGIAERLPSPEATREEAVALVSPVAKSHRKKTN